MKSAVACFFSVFFLVFVPFIFWLGGYDFDERGSKAVACAVATVASAVFSFVAAITYPSGK